MIHIGKMDLAFSVQAQSMDVSFDPTTHQQVLTFKFGVSVSVPQMLQQLQKFQFREAMPLAPPESLGMGGAPAPPGLSTTAPPGGLQAPASLTGRQGYPQIPARGEGKDLQPVVMPPGSNQGAQGRQLPAPLSTGQSQLQPPASADGAPEGIANCSSATLPLNMALLEALRENNFQKAQLAIQQRADVNCVEGPPQYRTPLRHALEMGGNVEMVNLLLQSLANVNQPSARGRTPLHYVIQHCTSIAPIIVPLLLTWKADLMKPDARGTTPLQTAKQVAIQLHTQQDGKASPAEDTRVRLLLNELATQPTVSVVVVEQQEVKKVLFADTDNDRLAFHTESAVGLYSLKNRRMIFVKRLRQGASSVKHVAVNPCLGTIAVCLSVVDGAPGEATTQNVFIIWPNGHIQDEEPLKLTMKPAPPSGPQREELLPPCVQLSRGQGPQMLVSRLIDGQIYCWRLNSARSQLMSEVKLINRGGLMATSHDGCWIAVVNKEDEANEQLEVWAYESLARPSPKHLVSVQTRPSAIAIIQQQVAEGGAPTCLLAVAEAAAPGLPQPPVEIIVVGMDGNTTPAYRIECRSLCHTLDFCGGPDLNCRLLCGHVDGLAIVFNPSAGDVQPTMSHDSPGVGHIAISTDHKLIASTEANYMRVYKVPTPDGQ